MAIRISLFLFCSFLLFTDNFMTGIDADKHADQHCDGTVFMPFHIIHCHTSFPKNNTSRYVLCNQKSGKQSHLITSYICRKDSLANCTIVLQAFLFVLSGGLIKKLSKLLTFCPFQSAISEGVTFLEISNHNISKISPFTVP